MSGSIGSVSFHNSMLQSFSRPTHDHLEQAVTGKHAHLTAQLRVSVRSQEFGSARREELIGLSGQTILAVQSVRWEDPGKGFTTWLV